MDNAYDHFKKKETPISFKRPLPFDLRALIFEQTDIEGKQVCYMIAWKIAAISGFHKPEVIVSKRLHLNISKSATLINIHNVYPIDQNAL